MQRAARRAGEQHEAVVDHVDRVLEHMDARGGEKGTRAPSRGSGSADGADGETTSLVTWNVPRELNVQL